MRPLANRLAGAGVTANQVTLAAVAVSLAAAGGLALHPQNRFFLLAIPVVMFVRMALNAIDGMLAREHGMKSPLGAILNELGDVVSDAALYGAFAFVPGLNPVLIVATVFLAMVSEMAGVVAIQIGASRRYDGPMGKSDRAFVFGTLAFLAGIGVSLKGWPVWLLGAVCLLLGYTIFNRCRAALREAG